MGQGTGYWISVSARAVDPDLLQLTKTQLNKFAGHINYVDYNKTNIFNYNYTEN